MAAEVAAAPGPVQHGELRIEALQHDLGGIAVLARLVLPFAGLQGAFEINLGALLQILLHDLAEPLVEDDDAVPLGLFLAFSGRLVAPAFGGGHPQIRDRPAVLGAPDFRIRTEISDQDDLVHRACHNCLLPAAFLAGRSTASRSAAVRASANRSATLNGGCAPASMFSLFHKPACR